MRDLREHVAQVNKKHDDDSTWILKVQHEPVYVSVSVSFLLCFRFSFQEKQKGTEPWETLRGVTCLLKWNTLKLNLQPWGIWESMQDR